MTSLVPHADEAQRDAALRPRGPLSTFSAALDAPGRARRAVCFAIAAHAVLTFALAQARFTTVHHRTFDLALYARLAWGLVHGQPWDPIVGGHFLGGHVPFVLLPLGALGAWLGTVPVLLCAQSLAVALAAYPLYRIAARRLTEPAAVVVALAWLLYPNLGHVSTYEMHPGTLALLPLCAAFDALDRRHPLAFALLCIVAMACRASLSLQTVAMGALACLDGRAMRRSGAFVALGSIAYFALVQFVLTPRFGPSLLGSLDLHFAPWGGSPTGILNALITRPHDVFAHFSEPRRLTYPLRVLAPFAFLPLLAPRFLLCALAPIALNLISIFPTTTELYSHYLTPALPALAFGSIHALTSLRNPGRLLLVLSLTSLLASVLRGGLPWSLDFTSADFRHDARTTASKRILQAIPEGASVQAPDSLLPHLAERRFVTRTPPPERETEYVVLDISHRRRYAHSENLLRTLEEPTTRTWLARPDHTVLAAEHDWLLLRRHPAPRAGLSARYFIPPSPYNAQPLTHCLALTSARIDTTHLTLNFIANAPCPPDLALRFGSDPSPTRVDLLFDGVLSPSHLRKGDHVHSKHALSTTERDLIQRNGLHLGVLRANGHPPAHQDPTTIRLSPAQTQ